MTYRRQGEGKEKEKNVLKKGRKGEGEDRSRK